MHVQDFCHLKKKKIGVIFFFVFCAIYSAAAFAFVKIKNASKPKTGESFNSKHKPPPLSNTKMILQNQSYGGGILSILRSASLSWIKRN